jgi:peptidoglycan/LPS O-acetylase OafA/YrhL
MPLTRLGDFVVGIVAALLVRNGTMAAGWARQAQVAGGVAMVMLMAWPALFLTAWSFDVITVVPVFVLLWGLASAPRTALARALGSRAIVLAGEASYAFYLLHYPLLGRLDLGVPDGWRGWVFEVTLQFVIILLLAIGAHLAIERPAQRWLRRTFGGNPAPARLAEG